MTDPDPQAEREYRAEASVSAGIGRRLARWVDVERFVESVVTRPEWADAEPALPLEITIERRSRSARYAAAHAPTATIWIPDGQWEVLTILHELAHLVAPDREPHGPRYVGALLWLVRWSVGIAAAAELRAAFDAEGVVYAEAVPGQPSAAAWS